MLLAFLKKNVFSYVFRFHFQFSVVIYKSTCNVTAGFQGWIIERERLLEGWLGREAPRVKGGEILWEKKLLITWKSRDKQSLFLAVSVSYCWITNCLKTQWLKTEGFHTAHDSASHLGGPAHLWFVPDCFSRSARGRFRRASLTCLWLAFSSWDSRLTGP